MGQRLRLSDGRPASQVSVRGSIWIRRHAVIVLDVEIVYMNRSRKSCCETYSRLSDVRSRRAFGTLREYSKVNAYID